MDLAKAAGAKLVKELVVSGAFHSPLMEPARESLFTALDHVAIRKPRCPVYANVSAAPVNDPAEIRQLLVNEAISIHNDAISTRLRSWAIVRNRSCWKSGI